MLPQKHFRTVRGMRDLLPEEAEELRWIEKEARRVAESFGYREIITPLIESYELLALKIGEENRRRMYVFEDLGGRKVALRPEFTASIARLVAAKMMNKPKPIRLFCTGSLYRYDEPQYGRYREFWQANYELIGSNKPDADIEILILTDSLMKRLNLKDYYVKIGHVGLIRGILCMEGIGEEEQNHLMHLLDKKMFDEAMAYLKGIGCSQKCIETLKNMTEARSEDKHEAIESIIKLVGDYREAYSAAKNLSEILDLLEEADVGIRYIVDAGFARGLEYYTGMIFEVFVPDMEIAIGGGGRYDRLIELFGGEPTPAVGVAFGIDRIMLALERGRTRTRTETKPNILIIPVNEEVRGEAFKISSILREAGLTVEIEVMGRTVSRSLSDADRRGITHTIIVGPKEIKQGKIIIRDMKTRKQREVHISRIPEETINLLMSHN